MKKVNYILLLVICWIIIVITWVHANPEVKVPDTNLDPKVSSTLKNKGDTNGKTDGLGLKEDTSVVEGIKDGKDQANRSEKSVKVNKKEGSEEQKQTGLVEDKKPDKGSDSKESTKELNVSPPPVRKEGPRVEECDASNSCNCKVEKIGLVACLRVPGNESPDLSLMVQNNGKGPLSVTISAPKFVQLEKTQIQLKENENYKMKVTITKSGDKNLIILSTGIGNNCTLDYGEIAAVLDPNKETITTIGSKSPINVFKRTPLIVFIFVGILAVAASAWMCVSFRKRHLNSSKYQKMDMDLPVMEQAKVEFDSNDGWDNSWGDDWDDEEAPKTPSMPLTPSVSSKGLASRRLIKEVWKD